MVWFGRVYGFGFDEVLRMPLAWRDVYRKGVRESLDGGSVVTGGGSGGVIDGGAGASGADLQALFSGV